MVNQDEPSLIQPLFEYLQQERFVLLSTVDYETGGQCKCFLIGC